MIKTCGCGKGFTVEEWSRLPLLGYMLGLELRDCSCGSTLGLSTTDERDWYEFALEEAP